MALGSGQISLGGTTAGESVNLELGQSATATISLNDANVRGLAGVPSGQIGMNNLQGKSAATYFIIYHGQIGTIGDNDLGIQVTPDGNIWKSGKFGSNQLSYVDRWNSVGTFIRNWRQTAGGYQAATGPLHIRPDADNIFAIGGYVGFDHGPFAGTPATNSQISYQVTLSGYQYIEQRGSHAPAEDPYALWCGTAVSRSCYGDRYRGMAMKTNYRAGTTAWVSVKSHPQNTTQMFHDSGICRDPSTGQTWVVGVDSSTPGSISPSAALAFRRVSSSNNFGLNPKVFAIGVGSYYVKARAAADPSGNLFITFYGSSPGASSYVYKYNTSGTFQWARKLSQPAGPAGTGVYFESCVADPSGNIYVTGRAPNDPNPNRGIYAKWNSSGVLQFQRTISTGNFTSGSTMRYNANNGAIVIGGQLGTGGQPSSFIMQLPTDGSKTGTYPTAQAGTWTIAASTFTEADGSSDFPGSAATTTPACEYGWSSMSVGTSQASRVSTAAPYNTGQDTTII